jgi:pimeloyl-ACP methyl ester carboxylesterase
MLPMIERRHLDLDGLQLSFLEKGAPTPGQPSLVLLHGLMGSAATFLPLIETLSDDLHIVALDFTGAGDSERRPDIDAGLASTAHQVSRFLEVLDLRQPVILGHSHGGAVGLRLAAASPRMLRSLILFAPAHPYFEGNEPLIRFYLSLPGRVFAYSMPWYPQWLQMIGLRRMAGPQSWDTPERLQPYRDNLRKPGTIAHLLRLLRTWKDDFGGLRRMLRKPLATPTLIVWGDCDRAVPVESSGELRAHLLRSELHVLRGVGHRPAEETPTIAAGLVERWLARTTAEPLPTYTMGSVLSSNSSASQRRSAALMTSSFESGD